MLAKRIIPCLDVKDGRVVKGVRFVSLRDAGDPVEVARRYDEEEADELTFLDITASHEKRDILMDVVRRTAEQVFMPLTVGGGVRTIDDIRNLLSSGADKVSINTAAVADPEFVKRAAERFGSQCTVVAVDARAIPGKREGWEVYTHGGRTPTGIDAVEWSARMEEYGAGEILLTSMDRDGTRDGYDIRSRRAERMRFSRHPSSITGNSRWRRRRNICAGAAYRYDPPSPWEIGLPSRQGMGRRGE